jgi:hypothetical protein
MFCCGRSDMAEGFLLVGHGHALFVGLTLVGVVEAKRRRKNVSAAIGGPKKSM